MSLSNVFDIAGTGMSAQSIRLNTTASNISNAETASSSVGETYRARHPVFSVLHKEAQGFNFPDMNNDFKSGGGVQVLGIVESQDALMPKYQPNHPMADTEGYVYYPNVNVMEEMANMISASRAYQMNVEMMNTAKSMMQRVLTLGQ